jgi:branched-chain amino acid transport system permease protein
MIAGPKPEVAASQSLGPAAWTDQRQWKRAGIGGLVLVLIIAIIFPLVFTNATVSNIAVQTVIFVAVASAWNIFSGYSGYLSLGHAIFFGTGAYATGIIARDWQVNGAAVFALLPLAGLIATVIAIPLGLIALRVRRHTFVVITIAFFFIAQLSASNLAITGGSSGLLAPVPNWSPATFNDPFYYVGLVIAIGTIVLAALIRRSRFGLQLRAIRDDEDRAVGLGVRAMPVKLTAFAISGFITAMAGGLWFFFLSQTFPQFAFDPLFDLAIVLMAFFGGLGTVAGPVLGALVLEPVQLYLNLRLTNDYLSEILLGVLFLVIILFMPRGVLPTANEFITAQRARLRQNADPTGGAGS